MTCKWCHEFCPPNRKDDFCSDICKDHWTTAMTPPDKAALLDRLQLCVDDPMWANHVEMPKRLLREVIEVLRRADEIREATIEECAKVAENWMSTDDSARAIRALAAPLVKTSEIAHE